MSTNQSPSVVASSPTWSPKQVYLLSTVFLLLGLAIGYFFLGTKFTKTSAVASPRPVSTPHTAPTMEQMKQMAAVQTSALLEKLKSEPTNVSVLMQIATIYKASHQCAEASDYYGRVLKLAPKNLSARTELASCMYITGDVDGAIAQLNQSLKYNPTDPDSLFNLGVIKWKGKNDPEGAIAVWQELLRTNPKLDRRPIVEHMIAEVRVADKKAK